MPLCLRLCHGGETAMSTFISILMFCGLLPLALAGCIASNSPRIPEEGMVLPLKGGSVVASVNPNGSRFGPFSSLNTNCSLKASAKVRVLKKPSHGTLKIARGAGDASFPADSPFAKCNAKSVKGTMVDYSPQKGYRGPDTFQFEIVFTNGERRIMTPTLTVID